MVFSEKDRRALYKKNKAELIEIIISLERDKRHLKAEVFLNE